MCKPCDKHSDDGKHRGRLVHRAGANSPVRCQGGMPGKASVMRHNTASQAKKVKGSGQEQGTEEGDSLVSPGSQVQSGHVQTLIPVSQ